MNLNPVATNSDLTVYLNTQHQLIITRDEKFAEVETILDQLEQTLTPDLFKSGKFNKEIDTCLSLIENLDDIEGLRRLAYILFSHKSYPSNEEVVLYFMLNCFNEENVSSFMIDQITLIMRAAIENFKKEKSSTDSKVQNAVQEKDYWSQNFPLNGSIKRHHPTDLVSISHGGGVYYLKQVFNGQKSGYFNDCLFVSPVNTNKDTAYARRTAPTKFDIGIVVKGQIQAQYLQPTTNHDEALLPIKNIGEVKNLTFNFASRPNVSDFPAIGDTVQQTFQNHASLKPRANLSTYIQSKINQKIAEELTNPFILN